MRGKLSDQDLTNYALNEGLDARGRRYVESIMAVSEECRNDVLNMMDVAQMLEEGFQQDGFHALPELTEAQRHQLLNPPRTHPATVFLRNAAAAMALAACLALLVVNPEIWQGHTTSTTAAKVAQVSKQVTQIVAGSSDNKSETAFAELVDLHTMVDDSPAWLRTATDSVPQTTTICTPPSLPSRSDFSTRR